MSRPVGQYSLLRLSQGMAGGRVCANREAPASLRLLTGHLRARWLLDCGYVNSSLGPEATVHLACYVLTVPHCRALGARLPQWWPCWDGQRECSRPMPFPLPQWSLQNSLKRETHSQEHCLTTPAFHPIVIYTCICQTSVFQKPL